MGFQSHLSHYTNLIRDSLNPLRMAYSTSRDSASACAAVESLLFASLHSGLALPKIEMDVRRCCRKLSKQHDRNRLLLLALPCWQYLLNMMGQNNSPKNNNNKHDRPNLLSGMPWI